jgi:hypothetical protein
MTQTRPLRRTLKSHAPDPESNDLRSRWQILEHMLHDYRSAGLGRPSPKDIANALRDFFRFADAPRPSTKVAEFICALLEKGWQKRDMTIDQYCREGNAANKADFLQKGGTAKSPAQKRTYQKANSEAAKEYGVGVKKLEQIRTRRSRERVS